MQNSWFHQLCKVAQTLKLQSTPKPSHYHHHVWLLVWCSFYEILCWFYAQCNGTHTFQKVKCLSHQSTEYLPKSLGNNQYICGKCETNPCVLGTLPWMPFLPSLFFSYCWIMNTDLYLGKWDLQFFRCCSVLFYYHLDESSLHSWSNFGRPATPGKVYNCSKCSPFVDNGSDRGSLESQSLKNGFIILSRLIHMGPVS